MPIESAMVAGAQNLEHDIKSWKENDETNRGRARQSIQAQQPTSTSYRGAV
jgi:hypothetical protein